MARTLGWLLVTAVAFAPALGARPSAQAVGGPAPREVELELGGGAFLKVVRIEPGKFVMGSQLDAGELPHEVEITRPFYMGVYTVTQNQYRQVMGQNPSYFCAQGGGAKQVQGLDTRDFPVEWVLWEDAVAFCKKASGAPALRARGWVVDLPTEAEWEYACRAGTKTSHHCGDSLSSHQANFSGGAPHGGAPQGPYLARTTKVGSYRPNAWGLYDMHGNVNQWCKDWHDPDYYRASPKQDPQGPAQGHRHVMRGGYFSDSGSTCRSAFRNWGAPDIRFQGHGFRVVVRVPSRDGGRNTSSGEQGSEGK
jgi:formylglycine-generating enzyme required for sulfatase activity